MALEVNGKFKGFLTPAEAAEFLAVELKWLYENWKKYDIPGCKFGKYLRFSVDELEHWGKSREQKSQREFVMAKVRELKQNMKLDAIRPDVKNPLLSLK